MARVYVINVYFLLSKNNVFLYSWPLQREEQKSSSITEP